jgi:hypothetical protein
MRVDIRYDYEAGRYVAHGTLMANGRPMRVTGPGCADETLEFTAFGENWPDARENLILQITVWKSMPANETVEI